jgi:Siphovirus ReqiPepy6 Gp37-like protein
MELYILGSVYERAEIVESFESLVWTERFNAYGDFELVIAPGLAEQALFVQGTRLGLDVSQYVMEIKTTEKSKNDDGVEQLKITGYSIEEILTHRPNKSNVTGALTPWTITGLPADLIRTLFHGICRTNVDVPADNIPRVQAGTLNPATSIPEPASSVSIQLQLGTLYDTIKQIADIYTLGFRLIKGPDDAKLYFEVYTGDDRTSGQTVRPAVVFSSELDNLTDTTELSSSALLKNVAYVVAPNGIRVVYPDGADTTVSGISRKVLVVDASDITDAAGAGLNAKLDQRGKEELAKNRVVVAFDGEISKTAYIYGTHYKLGDLVEQRNDLGLTTKMRVTEQIFISDAEGERSYPTLALDTLIEVGTWDSQSATKVWDDFTTETWDSM